MLCQFADSGSERDWCQSLLPSPAGPHQAAAPCPAPTGVHCCWTPEPQTQVGREQQCQEPAWGRDGLQLADGGQEQKVSSSRLHLINNNRCTAKREIEFILKAHCEQCNLVKVNCHYGSHILALQVHNLHTFFFSCL